jgi:hypothetical protein
MLCFVASSQIATRFPLRLKSISGLSVVTHTHLVTEQPVDGNGVDCDHWQHKHARANSKESDASGAAALATVME